MCNQIFSAVFIRLREYRLGDSRHKNIIESKKTSKTIICNYFGTRIREKVAGLSFKDVEANSGDMTALQGPFVLFRSEMYAYKRPEKVLTYRIKA